MTTNVNSRPQRQTLASQIDRLESILTGLTENLGQTVAEAVQDAVGKAVELAVKEVLTNPELLQALQAQTSEPAKSAQEGSLAQTLGQTWQRTCATVREKTAAAGATVRQHAGRAWTTVGEKAVAVKGWLGGVCSWIGGGLQTAWTVICAGCSKLASGCVTVYQMLPALLAFLWACRKPLLIALAVGLVVGLGCYLAGPLVASTVSGLAGFLGTLVAGLLKQLRQMVGQIEMPHG